jgi:hypothetical protein
MAFRNLRIAVGSPLAISRFVIQFVKFNLLRFEVVTNRASREFDTHLVYYHRPKSRR